MRSLVRFSLLVLPLSVDALPLRAQARLKTGTEAHLDSLRAAWSIEPTHEGAASRFAGRIGPAMSSSTPSAFIPEWGDVYVGAGYQHRSRPTPLSKTLTRRDGIAFGGIGIGRMDKLAVNVQLTSYSTYLSHLFEVGGLSLMASHRFANGFAAGAGAERVVAIGKGGDCCDSYYVMGSRAFTTQTDRAFLGSVVISAGLGTGRFQPVRDVWFGRHGINAFGAIGATVLTRVSAMTEWNGQDLTVGMSFKPFRSLGLVVSPALTDLTGHAESPKRFMIGMGYATNVLAWREGAR